MSKIKVMKTIAVSDISIAVFVALVASLLIIPVPTFLIDILIVFNIGIAILLLLASLYVPSAVSLLSFPSILLLTTLLRLSVNVASTRLILTKGDAGTVIHSFGTFLIEGEIVVGILLFGIISVVTLLVIARGAGRVSEVAARFTLDSLPGKQLAIDADLRAGTISPDSAKVKREELKRESMLYGSLDGAMKFVQGDAIAGLIIVFINILGGMYVGLSNGLDFSDALQTYTVLTVGDGLVSQIPAVLICMCSGIIVTRASGTEKDTLGKEVSDQVFSSPITLYIAAGVLFILGSLPALPFLPFFLLTCLFLGIGLLRQKTIREDSHQSEDAPAQLLFAQPKLLPSEFEEDEKRADNFILYLDGKTHFKSYRVSPSKYKEFWKECIQTFQSNWGILVPEISFKELDRAQPESYQIELRANTVLNGKAPLRHLFVESHPSQAFLLGTKIFEPTIHPLSKQEVFWTPDTLIARRCLEMGEIRFFDPVEVILLSLAGKILSDPALVIGLSEVHLMLTEVEKSSPGLLSMGLGANFLSEIKITGVLQGLISRGIRIRDIKSIVESIGMYCMQNSVVSGDDADVDVEDVIDFVGERLKKHQQSSHKDFKGRLRVFVVREDDEIEDDELLSEIEKKLDQQRHFGVGASSVVLEKNKRKKLKKIKALPFMTLEELSNSDLIRPIGVI